MLVLYKSLQVISTNVSNDMDIGDASTVVNGVSTIADSISKNGPVIVICAVFIVLFILMFILFIKINNDMIKNIIKQLNQKNTENSDVTQKLLNHFLEEDEKEEQETEEHETITKHHKDLVGMYIDYTTAFKREFKTIINSTRCDRVAVYVFHNGNQTLYGLPFIKMSCVQEDTMKGSMTMRGKAHMNLPLHLFNDFIRALYKDGTFAGNIDDVEIHDNSIREFLSFSDAKSVFMRAIKKEDGSLAGFTVIEFNQTMNFTDEEFYTYINQAVKDLNTSIRYIITDDEFAKKYEKSKDE